MTRRDKGPVRLTAILLTVTFLVIPIGVGGNVLGSSHYIFRGRILIDGNDAFTLWNGVIAGSGTLSDPYVIEGWEIDTAFSHGIEIRNTTAFFVVRGVYVHPSTTPSRHGILLSNVTNGRIEDSMISDNHHGIELQLSSNVTVARNVISSNRGLGGVRLVVSDNITVVDNRFSDNYVGIFFLSSTNSTVSRNVFTSDGILLEGLHTFHYTTHIITRDNVVNGRPLYFYKDCRGLDVDGIPVGQLVIVNCRNVRIRNLGIFYTDVGLRMAFVDDAIVTGNSFVLNTPFSVYLSRSTNVRVYHNNFIRGEVWDNHGNENLWDNGYPDGGNYWSRYAGVDNCSGAYQEICPEPDGIGDSPVTFEEGGQDRYPLVKPFVVPDVPAPPPDLLPPMIALISGIVGTGLLLVVLRKRPPRGSKRAKSDESHAQR